MTRLKIKKVYFLKLVVIYMSIYCSANIVTVNATFANDTKLRPNLLMSETEKKKDDRRLETMCRIVELAKIFKETCPGGIDMEALNVITGHKPATEICLWHNPEKELEAITNFVNRYAKDYGFVAVLERDRKGRLCPGAGIFYHKKAAEEALRNIPSDILAAWGIDSNFNDIGDVIYIIESSSVDDNRMGIFFGYPWQDVKAFMEGFTWVPYIDRSRRIWSHHTEWWTYPHNKEVAAQVRQKLINGESIVEEALMNANVEWRNLPQRIIFKLSNLTRFLRSSI